MSALPPELPGPFGRARSAPPPAARAAFRDELKQRFLAGSWPAEERLSAALDAWQPAARPAFRAALKRDFVGRAPALPAPLARRRRSLVPVGLAAAAAVLLALPLVQQAFAEPAWHAVAVERDDSLAADGRSLALDDERAISRALGSAGCCLETLLSDVHLAREDELLLRLDAHSELLLVELADVPEGERVELELRRGALGVSTGAGFRGVVRVRTGLGVVELRGRAVSVERVEGGLCVCCLRGSATIRCPGGETLRVPEEDSFFLSDAGVASDAGRLVHADSLARLDAVAGANLAR